MSLKLYKIKFKRIKLRYNIEDSEIAAQLICNNF